MPWFGGKKSKDSVTTSPKKKVESNKKGASNKPVDRKELQKKSDDSQDITPPRLSKSGYLLEKVLE